MTLLSRLRGEEQIDADRLVERVDAIDRFVHVVAGQLPEQRLIGAHTVVERAGARLALSRDHTVVALAGATGSGKSSLFNALARLDLSPVGVRRPTTGMAHACVWGNLQGANRLLDWVGVLPRHRFIRESALDGNDEAALRGLVLLDLPDFDSVERSHRLEVDRLLGLVDLVVWVVDPQKYADRVVHTRYLQAFHNHKDVTVVVLNQADRLPRPRSRGSSTTCASCSTPTTSTACRCWPRPRCTSRRSPIYAACWSTPSPSAKPRCGASPATSTPSSTSCPMWSDRRWPRTRSTATRCTG
ncbi:hypothetical protein Pflav_069040 [Phytohabitans flavus]|uniref:G domain-containing protein n=1 Tax=Phytohabitans flavus TaxID=1076124 RepID=A0A6F8Y301_9ACTN|nr:hypothetical protein Pflav_069040 [Phytohabitans flavus]